MSITDLLCYIRNQLIEANSKNDSQRLKELSYTLTVIEDAAKAAQITVYDLVIDDLWYAWQHIGLADHKVALPSEEQIRATTGEN